MSKPVTCYTCSGVGIKGGCPECGKDLKEITKIFSDIPSDSTINSGKIPEEYINMAFEGIKLIDSHKQLEFNDKFQRYVNQLEKVLQIFESGKIPNQSAIFIADRGFGKRIFAYNCLKFAARNGYSICPIIDNTELKRLSIISSDNYKSSYLYNKLSIDEILTSDVLFITVDCDNYGTALRTIESIMDKRCRFNKPTFVISRFSLSQMSVFDKDSEYISLIENTRQVNNKKYPVIIKAM